MATNEEKVIIWTDGASKGNPGLGGWGAWLSYKGHVKELCGGELQTTNNRMELTAAIMALRALKRPCSVVLHTDSKYVQQGMTAWIYGWQKNNWRTKSRTDVINKDLWLDLIEAAKPHQVEWVWVKGHDGVQGNERADQLANAGCQKALSGAKS